jgi:hypothetical protein
MDKFRKKFRGTKKAEKHWCMVGKNSFQKARQKLRVEKFYTPLNFSQDFFKFSIGHKVQFSIYFLGT